jgi:hypothetical protein
VVRALDVIVVSCIARVEVPAAICKKQRIGELTKDAASVLTADFEADYFGTQDTAARFLIMDISTILLDRAADLVATHALRAYDAIQLASACAARDADPACRVFACTDAALRAAAVLEGFKLVP